MTDDSHATPAPMGLLARFGTAMRQSDIALALGVIFILVALILPMPKWLLDITLTISLAFSALSTSTRQRAAFSKAP